MPCSIPDISAPLDSQAPKADLYVWHLDETPNTEYGLAPHLSWKN